MAGNKMANRFRRQMDLFYAYLAKTAVSQSVENIHRLRVIIKNIRSILVLMDKACGGTLQKKDHLKVYAALFRMAGQVRDIQVSLDLLKSNRASYLIPYKKHMRGVLKMRLRKLQLKSLAIDLKLLNKLSRELVKKIEDIHPGSLPEKTATLISHLLKRVKSLSQKPRDLKTLHDIRILLKTVQENLVVLVRLKPSDKWMAVDKKLRPLYEALGKWHDQALLIKSLKAFLVKTGPGYVHLERLVSRLEKNNHEKENKSYKLLQKLPAGF